MKTNFKISYCCIHEQTQRGVPFHILFTYLVFPSHAFRFPAIENITFSVLLIFLRTHTHIKRRTHKLFIRIFFYQRLTKNFSWSFHRLEQWSASYKKIWKINNGHINTQLPGQTFFKYTRYDKWKVFPSIRKTSIKCL